MAEFSSIKLSKSKRASNWGQFWVETEWDPTAVGRVLDKVDEATSGGSLMTFLQVAANPYMTDELVDRFAYYGDNKSGNWAPLAESTQRIREALGYDGSDPINERDGELLEFVLYSRVWAGGGDWAMFTMPGDPPSFELEQKLQHAQLGAENNPLIDGAVTPPRPVLATGADDMAALLVMLQQYIITRVAAGI